MVSMEGTPKLILVLHNRADRRGGCKSCSSIMEKYLSCYLPSPLQHFCYKLDQIVRESLAFEYLLKLLILDRAIILDRTVKNFSGLLVSFCLTNKLKAISKLSNFPSYSYNLNFIILINFSSYTKNVLVKSQKV